MDIKNKLIAITGGAQGIGLSMAMVVAKQGAQLALIDINEGALKKAAEQCQLIGASSRIYCADITQELNVESVFSQIVDDFGHIDVLINNAGILRDELLIKVKDGELVKKMSLASWQAVIDVNLTGVFLCGREAASHMALTKSAGVIVNIASVAKAGNIAQSNYSAAKAGVEAMTVTWAKELAHYDIRVGAIAPGFIATDILSSMPEQVLEKFINQVPLKRLGKPDEVAHSLLYILANDYFTGRTLEIDGGARL